MTKLPKDLNLLIRSWYIQDGLSVSEIGLKLVIPSSTVYRRLRSMGVRMRARGGPNNTILKLDKILARSPETRNLLDEDITLKDKAAIIGIDPNSIRAWQRKA